MGEAYCFIVRREGAWFCRTHDCFLELDGQVVAPDYCWKKDPMMQVICPGCGGFCSFEKLTCPRCRTTLRPIVGRPQEKPVINELKPPKPFFMVVVDGGTAPNARHETIEQARKEAARLASKSNARAYIMEPVAACDPVAQVQWISLGEKD